MTRSTPTARSLRAPLATLLATSLAPLAGCSLPGHAPGGATGEVVIGVAYNPQRPGMHEIARGTELAAEMLTRDSAARAAGLRFVTRQPPREITGAVAIAQRLRDDPSVVGIVGDAESGRTLDEIPVLEDLDHDGAHAVVAVSPTATSTALSGRSAWVFRVTPNDAAVSQAAAVYLADSIRARRAAVIYRNDSYGRDWTTAFIAAFRARGGAVVQRDPYVAGITEWDAIAAYTRRSGADAVLFPGSAEDAADYLRALRRVGGADVPFVGGDAVAPIAAQPEFAGARFATPYDASRAPQGRASQAFVAAYTARYREAPTARAALAYDATVVIGRAVLEVGRDRQRIRSWIAGLGGAHPALSGATGTLAFDARHDARDRSVSIVTVGSASAPATGVATR
jgi:branched-chain amino acid transport system substrate-binding protein